MQALKIEERENARRKTRRGEWDENGEETWHENAEMRRSEKWR